MKAKHFGFAMFLLLPLAASAQTADEIVNKSWLRAAREKIKAIQSERVTAASRSDRDWRAVSSRAQAPA